MLKPKYLFLIWILLTVIGVSSSLVNAQEVQKKSIGLNECTDKTLGIKIYCNPDWALETDKGTVLMIIESKPDLSVTATLTKIEEPNLRLNDLTSVYLKATDQYQDEMNIFPTHLTNYEALHVQALALKNADNQLSDYYIVQPPFFYGVLFSVTPKEKFNDYKTLFDKMIDSFRITIDKK